MAWDAIAQLRAPLPDEAPRLDQQPVLELAERLLGQRPLTRPASSDEVAVLLMAAEAARHEPTRRAVRVGLCEAAVRYAVEHDELAIERHLPQFRRRGSGHWETDAFGLLEAPQNCPPDLRLRHLQIHDGVVPLSIDLLHFHAVARLADSLPAALMPPWLRRSFPAVVRAFERAGRQQEAKQKVRLQVGDEPEHYPPCVKAWLAALPAGIHLKHFARYNLMSFLGRIGWDPKRITGLFTGRGYDEAEISYQAAHVRGRAPGTPGYAPMGCDQLRSLRLCPDSACPGPTPLSVYSQRRWERGRVRTR